MSEVLRMDLLDHGMNAGKEQKVWGLLRAWRRCAVLVAREQWRLFFEAGRFNRYHKAENKAELVGVIGAANRLQMVRHVLSGHRRPDLSRMNMRIDARAVQVREAENAKTFDLWIQIATLEPRRPIEIPLRAHAYFQRRAGERRTSIQVNEREPFSADSGRGNLDPYHLDRPSVTLGNDAKVAVRENVHGFGIIRSGW